MDTGRPKYAWLTLYKYAQSLSGYCLILLLVAIAKGWTIVRAALSPLGCLKIAGYATAYLLCIIFSETYSYGTYQYYRMSDYYYDNPAGDLVLVLKCGVAPIWILYAVNTTMQVCKNLIPRPNALRVCACATNASLLGVADVPRVQ